MEEKVEMTLEVITLPRRYHQKNLGQMLDDDQISWISSCETFYPYNTILLT